MITTIQLRWMTVLTVSVLCVAAGALIAQLPDGYSAPTGVITWMMTIMLGAIAWPTLRHRSLVGLILVYSFLSFGIFAALLYRPTSADLNGANAVVARTAQETSGYHYVMIFTGAAFAIWVACLAVGLLLPRRNQRFLTSTELYLPPTALWLAVLPLLANIYGTGLHTLFQANSYLENTGPIVAFRLGHALGPIGVLICGYFLFRRHQSTAIRVSALILALTYEAVYLATAARFFAFWMPLMFAGGLLTGSWSVRRQQIGLLTVAVVAVFALQVPLGLRNLPHHGLIPGVHYLLHQPSLVFGTHDPINNFLFGAPLTLYVAHDIEHLPINDVLTSVSPMPSHFNNWAQIAPHLRLNIYTPYSALGELLNHGWGLFIALMASFGAAFALTERLALRRSDVMGGLGQIVILGAAALFVVESTEYNLRSVTRLVYYAIVGVAVLVSIPSFSRSRLGAEQASGNLAQRT